MTDSRFDISSLELPIIGAPMAGGPTTPALAAAVSHAGGLGMLAAGYLTADALAARITEAKERADASPLGVNVFCPGPDRPDGWSGYRDRLAAAFPEVDLPTTPTWSDEDYAAKIDLLTDPAHAVEVVTFAFGLPGDDDVARLHGAGSAVGVTVTNAGDARAAADTGADFLVAQGIGAGGHQSTFTVTGEAASFATRDVVKHALAAGLPVVAAGGVSGRDDVRVLLDDGAAAVAVGTLLLTADEAGTRSAHKRALLDGGRGTVLTRCFSGRLARALENDFTRAYTDAAPAAYPHVHYLTSPIRAWAGERNDAENINLWAGVGYGSCVAAPAADILAALDPR